MKNGWIDSFGDLIFWIIWIPVCVILMLSVVIFAYLNCAYHYTKSFFKKIFKINDR